MLACTIWQKYDREQMEQQLIIKVWQEMCPDLATTPPLMHPNPVWQKNGKSSSFQTWNVFVEIEDSIACQTFVWPSQHRFKYSFVWGHCRLPVKLQILYNRKFNMFHAQTNKCDRIFVTKHLLWAGFVKMTVGVQMFRKMLICHLSLYTKYATQRVLGT